MAVKPSDILFRAGGATLKRLQTLVSGGAGRIEVAHTFTRADAATCASYRDRDGTLKKAAANALRVDWPYVLADAGVLLEGAAGQAVTDPENFGLWTLSGSPVRTSGQADPFGGTGAYLLNDDDAAAFESILEVVSFTGNAEKAFSVYAKQGTSSASWFRLRDITAGADRHLVTVSWSAGVPTLATGGGAGVRFAPEQVTADWWRLAASATGVIAANTNRFEIAPSNISGVAATGTTYFYGANAWNSPMPSSFQTGVTTRAPDSLTSPFNWGPSTDITVLVRLSRSMYASAIGTLGISPGIFSFGAGTAPRIGAYFDPAARNIVGVIDTATTDATQSTAIPAGNPTVCFQFKNLTTGGQVAIDTGSGYTAFSSAATGFSSFSSQTVRIGRYDDELYGVIGDMVVARGLQTRADMLAIP